MIIIALDFNSKHEVENFLKKFSEPIYVKVGMELFYAEGPEIISLIKKYNHKIFLDLKLHDIPTTVNKALSVINNYDVDIVNVHAKGGSEMLQAARLAITNAKLIAVTELTSTSQETLDEISNINLDESIEKLVKITNECNLDGVVCSGLEAKKIKETYPNLITVCPGIRLSNQVNDQKRVIHPSNAKENKVDFMVVGRDITKSNNPIDTYNKILGAYNHD